MPDASVSHDRSTREWDDSELIDWGLCNYVDHFEKLPFFAVKRFLFSVFSSRPYKGC